MEGTYNKFEQIQHDAAHKQRSKIKELNKNLIAEIKAHPRNQILQLLLDLGWSPERTGSSPQGNCITGHSSESQKCFKVFTLTNSSFCFNCGLSFDVFDIVKALKGCDFKYALEFLADRAGIVVKQPISEEEKKALASCERTKEILNLVTRFWNQSLLENSEGMGIMTKRYGLSIDTITKNRIGLCSIDTATLSHLKELGFSDLEIQKSGIVYPEGKGYPREFFEGRIVFPYLKNGMPVYLVGRKTHLPTRPGSSGEDNSGKYIKLPTAHGTFKDLIDASITGDAIFGEDTIREKENVVIAEGVTDCLAAQQLGLASISPVTTSFSHLQMERLFFLLKDKVVLVTGDREPNKAGEKGAWKTTEALLEKGIDVWYAKIPDLDTSHRPKIQVPEVFKYPEGKTDLNDIITTLGSEGFAAVKRASVQGYQAFLLKAFPDIESIHPKAKDAAKAFSRLTNYDSDRYFEMTNCGLR